MSSVNNAIPMVPENTIDPASGLNEAIKVMDALLQLRVTSVGTNAPPASPANGDRYIVGTSPTGAWTSQANKLAQYLDGDWLFYAANIVADMGTNTIKMRKLDGTWT